ncbi:ATP-binding protein [Microbacterium sp.]|uniref:sensor histidine kinase n=1 Tax=Microbacterium sp. TaxID=51671 RepID=UPI0028122C03|nr:ATP-binding protein [Microbacterium sp.]
MRRIGLDTQARAVRRVMIVLPSVIVLAAVALTTVVAITLQERSIRDTTAQRVHEVATGLAALREVRTALGAAAPAGTPGDTADAADLASATAALQPLADLVERTAGVYYVVITDDEGVRITHPDPAQRGVQVATTTDAVLAGEEFLGTETGPSGPSLRAKVPVRAADEDVVGMVAVGILESSISAQRDEAMGSLLPWTFAALVAATLASSLLAAAIERRFRRLDAVQAQHEQLRHVTAALREQSHEFGTRLHVIHGLVSHGDKEEALQYIDGIVPVLTSGGDGSARPTGLLSASIEALRTELGALGTRLETDMDMDIPIDEGVLLVFANLSRNGAEAGAASVRCTLRHIDGRFVGSVVDDGPGIDPADIDRVFTRGYSSKPDASGAGRGLGLDLVRRTVTSRGGTIELRRTARGGTRFDFDLADER